MSFSIGNKMRCMGHAGAMKFAHCTDYYEMLAVNPNYRNWQKTTEFGQDGQWVYPLTNLVNGNGVFWMDGNSANHTILIDEELPNLQSSNHMFLNTGNNTNAKIKAPNLPNAGYMFVYGKKNSILELDANAAIYAEGVFSRSEAISIKGNFEQAIRVNGLCQISNITKFECNIPNAEHLDYLCSECKKLTTVECGFPHAKSMHLAFNLCILNKESALTILNSLPTWTDNTSHKITMGIHIDHKNDEEIATAITNAANRGWTITTQWNGTATAASYSLRPRDVSTGVYAKTFTYNDHDDNEITELDWCHEVSDANYSEPEELGYMYFDSLDLAYEYFGLENKN